MKSFVFTLCMAYSGLLFAQSPANKLRTNGVYIYDNGIRTYTPAKGAIMDTIKNLFPKVPSPLYDLYPRNCVPAGAIGAGINKNSMITILMFSKSGYCFEYITPCRDEKTWETIQKVYADFQKYASSKVALSFGVERVKFLDAKVFIVESPKVQLPSGSYGSSTSFLLYKDSVVERKTMPAAAFAHMDEETKAYIKKNNSYVFTTFEKLPESFKGGIQILKPVEY